MCTNKRAIRNPKYKPNKKNGGFVPIPKDQRLEWIDVPCGKCYECRRAKASEWRVRLSQELKRGYKAHFVTYTFAEEWLEEMRKKGETDESAVTIAIREWTETIRKKCGQAPRHWLITERGQDYSRRIHVHGIVWENENWKHTGADWKYGNTWTGNYVNERTINYIVKYVNKEDEVNHFEGKIYASKGIGKNFLSERNIETYRRSVTEKNKIRLENGTKVSMPMYYRRKIYNDEEREEQRIEMMNREEKWVDGKKYKITNEKEYRTYAQAVRDLKKTEKEIIRKTDRNNLTIEEKEPTFAHRNLPNWEDIKL